MSSSDPTRTPASTDDPDLRDALREMVGFGVRIARVAAEAAEAEGRIVAIIAAGLPTRVDGVASLSEAQEAGLAVDTAEAALAQSSPRIATAAQAFERVSRAVRRTAALMQRIEYGWPRHGGSDDRQAMARRQIARSVGDVIAQQAHGEAAERLFDDLAERLDCLERNGGLDQPVEVVVAEICRELGLVEGPLALPAAGAASPAGDLPDG